MRFMKYAALTIFMVLVWAFCAAVFYDFGVKEGVHKERRERIEWDRKVREMNERRERLEEERSNPFWI